jgi:C_GCAxxG_C_C family probable redox protein
MATGKSSEHGQDAVTQKARELLAACGNCAQASFATLDEAFDLDGEKVLKALTPLPGIALRGETCGAVIGCMMALGLVFGRDELGDWKGYIASLPSARRFCRRFEEAHGGLACATILEEKLGRGFDLANRADALEYVAAGGPQACGEVVATAVLIACEEIDTKAH